MNHLVYMDNSATTRVSDRVLSAMLPYLKEEYGNPSSLYGIARSAKAAIERAREQVAAGIGALPTEIYFTGCGTEADNWALKGVLHRLKQKGKTHLITTAFEHHAILHTAESLSKEGFTVTYLPVSHAGLVDPADVKAAIRPETALVSVMYVNNEIGTIQPVAEIGAICKQAGVLFHTDAVQAVGNVHIDVGPQNIDLLSLSGHKIHAPKGVGALYIRKGVLLQNFMEGGAQERGKRAGTENVASIVGLGVAVEEACANVDAKNARLKPLRDKLIDGLLKIDRAILNGDRDRRVAMNANLSFPGVEGESLLLMLDAKGVAASSGSACTSGSLDPSHVLLAIGLKHEIAHGSLRLRLGDDTTPADVDYVLDTIPPIIKRLRDMSPLWESMNAGKEA